jgi:uncharacterized protein (TIGR03118 family)
MNRITTFFLGTILAITFGLAATPAAGQYKQINLVSDEPGLARFTDSNLLDPWGLVFLPQGRFAMANTHSGTATIYGPGGKPAPLVITVPPAPSQPFGPTGTPTGMVTNSTSGFVISKNGKSVPALFLFDTLDGTISGWNPDLDPNNAIIAVDNSTGSPFSASYTALAFGRNGKGETVLYAADSGGGPTLSNNRIDMYDSGFNYVGSFGDPSTPSNMTVFGIQNIDGKLYVTYAAFAPLQGGVVDVFDTDGNLLQRFSSNDQSGPLEEPWAVTLAPGNFGEFGHSLLVGNFGDGKISAFDPETRQYLGQLSDRHGNPITAGLGLWGIGFRTDVPKGGPAHLFFASGINGEANGLFGSIVPVQ